MPIALEGDNVASPYTDRVAEVYSSLKFDMIDDALFTEMSGLAVPAVPPRKPIRLESRYSDMKATLMGRILYAAVLSVAKRDMRRAKKLPEGSERDNKIKAALFLERILDSNSLVTMSMSSCSQFPYNFAEGFVHLANGRIFKGAKCFLTKIKAPALPKENVK